jgi:glycosyltransferase involved in cell wall biosynthesis
MLVKTDEDWLAALEELIRNPDLRRRLGEAARSSAVSNYSTKAIAGQYRRVLDDVMGHET